MPRQRTAADRLIALLARSVFPLTRNDLMEDLGMNRTRLAVVLGRCLEDGSVVRHAPPHKTEGMGSGRPSERFALPGQPPPTVAAPNTPAIVVHLMPETMVVTPSNKLARVRRPLDRGHYEIEVLGVAREDSILSMHGRLLRAYQPGRPRPEPVRIKD